MEIFFGLFWVFVILFFIVDHFSKSKEKDRKEYKPPTKVYTPKATTEKKEIYYSIVQRPSVNKKSNWQDFQKYITDNNIVISLYHFTDTRNIESIRGKGGLFSWEYCQKNGIYIPAPGGNELSKSLDIRYNLQNYVRLCFVNDHPMIFKAKDDGRIKSHKVLEIDFEVIFWDKTIFADRNATSNVVTFGGNLNNFKNIKFDIIRRGNYLNLQPNEKPFYQAEVLVYEKIPIEFIKNI